MNVLPGTVPISNVFVMSVVPGWLIEITGAAVSVSLAVTVMVTAPALNVGATVAVVMVPESTFWLALTV